MGIRWKKSKESYGPKKPGRIRRWISYWRNHWKDLKWLYIFSLLSGVYFLMSAYDFLALSSYSMVLNIYVSGIVLIALFVLMYGQIHKDTSSPSFMNWMKNCNMDVLVIIYILFFTASVIAVVVGSRVIVQNYYVYNSSSLFLIFLILSALNNAFIMVMIRHFKNPALRNATLTKKLISNISVKIKEENLKYQKKYEFEKKNRTWINGLLAGLSVLALWQLSSILGRGYISFFSACLFIILLAGLGYWLQGHIKFLNDVGTMVREIHHISEGNSLDLSEIPEDSMLSSSRDDLTHIYDSLSESIDKQVRSEKMKIDLITNVSHDLKTPLTSIISYIDLLRKTELSDEAKDYVEVLAQKADRLKNMIQDVFEVSKATSGNAEIQIEQLDICRLAIQTLGDMEDRIEKSGRTIKKGIPDESIYIMGDGRKLYRVYQNVIENALKYSMEGTRIFVDIVRKGDLVETTVKNISSYEMNFTEDTITERFTRGDVNRTTEGHGLGLAIVKSFSEACGGSFHINIDGDLFKAILTFPCVEYKEPEPEINVPANITE